MKLTINEIYEMTQSCVKRLINEIKMSDAYANFYKDVIPQEIWNGVTRGAANMTPFHRAAIDLIVKEIKNGGNVGELLDFANLVGEAWNKGKTAQQFINNAMRENFWKFDTIPHMQAAISNILGNTKFTENEFLDNGLYKAYEDERILVTVTLSYTASRKYYGDSHWCTASGIDGKWNGFKMFKSYAEDAILAQIVDKKDRQKSCQIAYCDEDISTCCDFMDNQIEPEDLYAALGEERMKKIDAILSEKFYDLLAASNELVRNEEHYYDLAETIFIKNNAPKFLKKKNSQECADRMTQELREKLNGTYEDPFELGTIRTDSFQFEIYRVTNVGAETSEGVNALVVIYPRQDFYIMDDDGNEFEDEDAKARSFFTEKDINMARRLRGTYAKKFGNATQVAQIYFPLEEGGGEITIVKRMDGSYSDNLGKGLLRIANRDTASLVTFPGLNIIYSFDTNKVAILPADNLYGYYTRGYYNRYVGCEILQDFGTADEPKVVKPIFSICDGKITEPATKEAFGRNSEWSWRYNRMTD